jgi:SAM-dependent methyltransferase
MHASAFMLGKRFFEVYSKRTPGHILDVGSRDINGSLRACAPQSHEYIGIDIEAGKGVDIVLQDPYAYPFSSKHFDLVVSTSTFEHDKFYWITFMECCRVLKDGGFLYINSPSNGSYHGYPHDYWRFYPDASLALRDWAVRMLQPIWLVESFIAPQAGSEWNDCVMIFAKQPNFVPTVYLSDEIAYAHNVHRGTEEVRNYRQHTQDQAVIAHFREQLQRPAAKQ